MFLTHNQLPPACLAVSGTVLHRARSDVTPLLNHAGGPQKTCCGQDCHPNMAEMFHLSNLQGTLPYCAGTLLEPRTGRRESLPTHINPKVL